MITTTATKKIPNKFHSSAFIFLIDFRSITDR